MNIICKLYSYNDCFLYSLNLLKKYSQEKSFFNKEFDYFHYFQHDIILICESLPEKFWLDFYRRKLISVEYDQICNKIWRYLVDKEPVAYLNNNCFFDGFKLEIKKGVFIPQIDTEIVVDSALLLINKLWNDSKTVEVLEIGTGSGNISISLALRKSLLKITSVDINDDAIKIAKKNIDKFGLSSVTVFNSNLFSNLSSHLKFDVIISNPPYISQDEFDNLSEYTRKQPKSALISPENGYWFYNQIISRSHSFLNKKFLVIFEIGCRQEEGVIKIIVRYFPNAKIEVFKDFSNNKRVVAFYNQI